MRLFLIIVIALLSTNLFANSNTKRTGILSNQQVSIWETTIYPSAKQMLKSHRHDLDRVVVALTDGSLKVTNNKGKTHILQLKKDMAYFLPKDAPGELHTDENIGHQPLKVIVIELRNRSRTGGLTAFHSKKQNPENLIQHLTQYI